MKTPNFEFLSASCFVIIFRKRLKPFVKKMTKTKRNTMLMETQNLESLLNEKKIQTKIQKLSHFFKKTIVQSWFKTILTTSEMIWIFTQLNIFEFFVTKKVSGGCLETRNVWILILIYVWELYCHIFNNILVDCYFINLQHTS